MYKRAIYTRAVLPPCSPPCLFYIVRLLVAFCSFCLLSQSGAPTCPLLICSLRFWCIDAMLAPWDLPRCNDANCEAFGVLEFMEPKDANWAPGSGAGRGLLAGGVSGPLGLLLAGRVSGLLGLLEAGAWGPFVRFFVDLPRSFQLLDESSVRFGDGVLGKFDSSVGMPPCRPAKRDCLVAGRGAVSESSRSPSPASSSSSGSGYAQEALGIGSNRSFRTSVPASISCRRSSASALSSSSRALSSASRFLWAFSSASRCFSNCLTCSSVIPFVLWPFNKPFFACSLSNAAFRFAFFSSSSGSKCDLSTRPGILTGGSVFFFSPEKSCFILVPSSSVCTTSSGSIKSSSLLLKHTPPIPPSTPTLP
mmetsp:Transcript_38925/g.90764  ORF Transcript_38925/g.90764 Transcript_38925/m.90764 type:complete len:364 (-) Transcript_38925:126-1217(-)